MNRGQVETLKVKRGLREGYGLMRCPEPGCEHVLCEMSKRFWHTRQVEKIVCVKCGRSTSLIACLQTERNAGELLVRRRAGATTRRNQSAQALRAVSSV